MTIYYTFEEMVAAAKEQGATHLSMGSYHDGAFWIFKPAVWSLEDLGSQIVYEMVCREKGKAYAHRPVVHAINHFHDGGADGRQRQGEQFRNWSLGEFMELYDGIYDVNDNQFIPIEKAIEWYKNWNKYYTGE